ncbi:MAG: PEP-CTERM sorting domain-containing protein [Vicinamibacteria bacterium]
MPADAILEFRPINITDPGPGETLVVNYAIALSTKTGGASEIGMQALFGDPLNFSTPGGSFSFFLADRPDTSVPEPATAALIGVGLVAASLLRRYRSQS